MFGAYFRRSVSFCLAAVAHLSAAIANTMAFGLKNPRFPSRLTRLFVFLALTGLSLAAATAPTITTQPANQKVTLGSKATFKVVASGSATLTYQWLKNGTTISGATSASYTTPTTVTTDNGTSFKVTVKNSVGSVTSNSATLTLNLPPSITTQPSNKSVVVGSTASFTVVASGTGTLTYQWSKNGTSISGATAASYTTPATKASDNGVKFTVKVTNSYGNVTSSSATLIVNSPPSITTQPASKSVTLNSTATFTVVASGTAPLSYQWSKNGIAISGATAASYTTPATAASDNGATYTVIVTNAYGNVTSSTATLTVNLPPSITSQPASQSVLAGSTATFAVVASGTAPLTYQWSRSGTAISGATATSYTTPATKASDSGATFSVKVTNVSGSITSSSATLTVTVPVAPSITTQPVSQSVYVGSTATFSVVASGTGSLTYQWSKNGTAISGATSASYTTPATVLGDNASTFSVNVTNSYGNISSSPATLIVMAVPPVITTQPANQTVTLGSTATFAVVASGTGPLTYQWYKNGTAISGATAASYTTPATVTGDNYSTFAVFATNPGGSTGSIPATLNCGPPPSIDSQPYSYSVNVGQSAYFASDASGMGMLTYQWFKNGLAILGATGYSTGTVNCGYSTPPTVIGDNASIFTFTVTNAYGSITSSPIKLTVTGQAPWITTAPVNQTVPLGSSATFTVVGNGTVPLTYQWSKNGAAISGATTASYTTPPTASGDGGSIYSVTVGNDYGSVISSSVGLFLQAPAVQVIPAQTTVSLGGVKQFQALVQSGSVTWSVVEANGGTIDQNGVYQAPSSAGTYTIKANSSVDLNLYGIAKVVVSSTGGQSGPQPGPPVTGNPGATGAILTMMPGTLEVDAGTTYPFSASVAGSDDSTLIWQVVGNSTDATIDQNGVFVAQREGIYQVEAVSYADSTATVVGQVSVQSSVHTTNNNPLAALRGYSVTTLANGKVLIAGGSTSTDPQSSSAGQFSSLAYIYDPTTQVFTPTGSMIIGRSDHKATLLPDGRVLITSGMAVYSIGFPSSNLPTQLGEVIWAEVYDPNSGIFVKLNGPGLLEYFTLWGDTLCLSNGDTILLPGGDSGLFWSMDTGATQVYTAATGLFIAPYATGSDIAYPGLQRYDYNKTWTDPWNSFVVTTPPKCGVGVVLNDGRGIAIGGIDCVPDMNEAHFLWSGSTLAGSALGAWNSVHAYNQAGFCWSTLAPMNVSRGRHTTTKLSDGRVLVVGGGTGASTDPFGRVENLECTYNGWREVPLIDTPTAEIYDPAADSWTMVGSLSQSRQGHAAVLLPDGRVLILGGRHYIQGVYPNATYTYPNFIEIFDPATNAFSVMDQLDYGLSEPKLALLQDGSVFVAGQVQAPMALPTAQTSELKRTNLLMAANANGGILMLESVLCGTVKLYCPPNVQRFLTDLNIQNTLQTVAKALNTNVLFIAAHASLESGWLDAHNTPLNNLFGLTKAGGNNLSFASLQDSGTTYVNAPAVNGINSTKVYGATTIDDFINQLQCACPYRYNTTHMDTYPDRLRKQYNFYLKMLKACGCSQ